MCSISSVPFAQRRRLQEEGGGACNDYSVASHCFLKTRAVQTVSVFFSRPASTSSSAPTGPFLLSSSLRFVEARPVSCQAPEAQHQHHHVGRRDSGGA